MLETFWFLLDKRITIKNIFRRLFKLIISHSLSRLLGIIFNLFRDMEDDEIIYDCYVMLFVLFLRNNFFIDILIFIV